jgi:hypothetical protein
MDQALTLLLYPYLSLIGGSRRIYQAQKLWFSYVLVPTCSHELALKKGGLPCRLVNLNMGRA